MSTAALPVSLARLERSWCSSEIRSTTDSTAEFNNSTSNTSNTLATSNAHWVQVSGDHSASASASGVSSAARMSS